MLRLHVARPRRSSGRPSIVARRSLATRCSSWRLICCGRVASAIVATWPSGTMTGAPVAVRACARSRSGMRARSMRRRAVLRAARHDDVVREPGRVLPVARRLARRAAAAASSPTCRTDEADVRREIAIESRSTLGLAAFERRLQLDEPGTVANAPRSRRSRDRLAARPSRGRAGSAQIGAWCRPTARAADARADAGELRQRPADVGLELLLRSACARRVGISLM